MATLLEKAVTFFESEEAQNILEAGEMAATVKGITGSSKDAGLATGYGAWVESITGKYPKVLKLPENRAKLVHSKEQIKEMQLWFDSQVATIFKPAVEQPSLQIDFGPIIKPWALKYSIPAFAGIFAVGWIAHWLIYK